jgi:hypothetical protein
MESIVIRKIAAGEVESAMRLAKADKKVSL